MIGVVVLRINKDSDYRMIFRKYNDIEDTIDVKVSGKDYFKVKNKLYELEYLLADWEEVIK